MSTGKKTVPEIRFSGFSEPWAQRKLGDLAEIVGGGTPDTNNSAYWDGDIDWYAPAEMEGQRYAKGSVRKITELGLQKSSAKILPAHRTVLFTSRAGIGKMAILQRSGATNQGFQSLVLKDGTDPYFIYSMGEKIKDMAEGVASGSTFLEISGKMLGNLEIMVPNLKEQGSIATFFRSIDDLIAIYQHKYEALVAVKKAMLEKMFPREGETVPQIRFAGFADPWEQRKFEDIAVRSSSISSESGLPRVEYEDIISGTGRLNKDIFAKESDKTGIVFHKGDVLYGKLRPYLQNWLLPSFNGLAVGDFWVLQPQNADSSFLYRLIQSRQFDEVANQSTGTKMPRSDWKLVSKTEFFIPSAIGEQAAIGAYFEQLDNLITLHQRKCEVLKNLKSALLNKMFVNTTE